MEDWKIQTDLLQCSPNFYNHSRYNCILVKQDEESHFFAQLVFLFECKVGGVTYPLALIHPYDEPRGHIHHQRDTDLHLHRVRARSRIESRFISVDSIVQGSLLANDYDEDLSQGQDFLIMDSIDSDMFLRMKSIKYIH